MPIKNNYKTLHVVYPNSLFEKTDAYKQANEIWFVEEPVFFSQHEYHKQKLVLHRASMKIFADSFDGKKYKVRYFDHSVVESSTAIFDKAKREGFHKITVFYPSDYLLEKRINDWARKNKVIALHWLESLLFLNTRQDLKLYFGEKDSFVMEFWYREERKKRNILMTEDGGPVGGSWNYDEENRKSLPKGHILPDNPSVKQNKDIKEAIDYVNNNFTSHYGIAENFWFPATHKEANEWFDNFLEIRFKDFGPYEDAIKKDSDSVLYHSVLSPLINIGLLEVQNVIDKALDFANEHSVPLNSLEGFIRQIVGWREFMHGLYLYKGSKMRSSNFFEHKRDMPEAFWGNGIGVEPVDDVIQKAHETAYAHHIERLMVVSNYCVLAEFDPDQVYGWFMEMFIDAYDWVMVPNIYSMALFADGGIMATKPYISSSNYINKMSDYKRKKEEYDHWSYSWDALYWRFMHKHRDFFEKNARMARLTSHLDRMDEEELDKKLNKAAGELRRLSEMNPRYSSEEDRHKLRLKE